MRGFIQYLKDNPLLVIGLSLVVIGQLMFWAATLIE